MSYYDISMAQSGNAANNPLSWLSGKVSSLVKSMQYAQTVRALSELSDQRLAMIDLRRADIPSYANELVYGSKS